MAISLAIKLKDKLD